MAWAVLPLAMVVAAVTVLLLAGCSTTGVAMRPQDAQTVPPGSPPSPSLQYYIEGQAQDERHTRYSCSFVEFDGRGDHIDYRQHRAAYSKVLELAAEQPLLLVVYCHGWKHSVQSDNVVQFCDYLGRLAMSAMAQEGRYRVHGLYIGWRGGTVRPYVATGTEAYSRTTADFGGPVVDRAWQRRWKWTGVVPENLDYWDRLKAAEHEVSGVAMARTILWCANAAKKNQPGGDAAPNLVFVVGHSMGALVLERSLCQACLGTLAGQLPWRNPEAAKAVVPDPLPFDLVLFVNSAAPAIYAKQTRDFLTSYRKALKANGIAFADAPLFMSLTSSADRATGVLHPLAHSLDWLDASLRRTYRKGLLGPTESTPHPPVPQRWFSNTTPGHHPLLVNHWIVPACSPTTDRAAIGRLDAAGALDRNLALGAGDRVFFTSAGAARQGQAWEVRTSPPEDAGEEWRRYRGQAITLEPSDYWIIRCGRELIRDHGDIWSPTTMEAYTALFRMAQATMLERRRPGAR